MVVLCPLFEGELEKRCSCGHIGLASHISERTSFYLRRTGTAHYESKCRRCYRERNKRYQQENREKVNASSRERRRRLATQRTPEEQKALRERWRDAKRAAVARDPEGRRIDRMLQAERKGKPLPSLEEVRRPKGSCGQPLPIYPFLSWVSDLIRYESNCSQDNDRRIQEDVRGRVANSLGVSKRRLYAWSKECETIDYLTVDRAASRHGGMTPEQIYWHYGKELPASVGKSGGYLRVVPGGNFVVYRWEPSEEAKKEQQVIRSTTKSSLCRTRKCHEPASSGSRFCPACAERLAKVKALLEGESHAFRKTIGKKNARPTCCNPACSEPRSRGDRYCDICRDEGWDEDSLE